MDFKARQVVSAQYVEAHDDRSHCSVREIHHAGGMSWHVDGDLLSGERLAADGAYWEARLCRAGNTAHRAEQVYQCGEIIRPHVQHRSATGLVVKFRIRVPRLDAVRQEERSGRDRLADHSVVDQLSASLSAAAEKR